MTFSTFFTTHRLIVILCLFSLSPLTYSASSSENGVQVDSVRNLQRLLYRIGSDLVVYKSQHNDQSAYERLLIDLSSGQQLIRDDSALSLSDKAASAWLSFHDKVQQEVSDSDFEEDLGWSFSVRLNQLMRDANQDLESLLPPSQHLSLEESTDLADTTVILQYMIVRYSARSYITSLRVDNSRGVLEEDLNVLAQAVTNNLNASSEMIADQDKASLKKAAKLWRFIEPRLSNFGGDLAPFIVNRMGGQIIDELDSITTSD